MASTIKLQSLLETHDQPFAIIDAGLKIVAVNRAYEISFGIGRERLVGQPCCRITGEAGEQPDCRHRRMFQEFEPYRLAHSVADGQGNSQVYQVRGYPLVDADNVIYLGESIQTVAAAPQTTKRTQMAGESMVFRKLTEQLELAAASNVPVLLQGETGTGKEVAAEFIHSLSPRWEKSLVVVDCTVLGEDLFESEVFGHEKGAFTGAVGNKKGLFELADQGTLFLDEIGELPLSQQPKLLRALESGTYRRVGGAEIRRSDVRVVSATHRNLVEMVRRGLFREDLYYRLAVFTVAVPPLRERIEDIASIAEFLLGQIGGCQGRKLELSKAALNQLRKHPFPGNIRELRNVLQLAATLARNGQIDAEHVFFSTIREADQTDSAPPGIHDDADARQPNPLKDMEAGYIEKLLKKYDGNRRLAASEMNVSERTLYRKLKRYQLHN